MTHSLNGLGLCVERIRRRVRRPPEAGRSSRTKQHNGRQIGVLLGIGAAAILTSGEAVRAQDRGTVGVERQWEVVVSLGAPVGGVQNEIEAAMAASGFDDTSIGDVEHPFSSSSEIAWAASLRRRIRPRLDVELIATRAMMGSTLGYDQAGLDFPFGHNLFLDQSVTTIAPIVSYRLGIGHVGAGPAASRLRLERTDSGSSEAASREAWKLSALLDAGVSLPSRSRIFFEGRAQYRWIPGTKAGPFTSTNGLEDDAPTTMPAVEVDWSHSYFSVGMGARF